MTHKKALGLLKEGQVSKNSQKKLLEALHQVNIRRLLEDHELLEDVRLLLEENLARQEGNHLPQHQGGERKATWIGGNGGGGKMAYLS